MNNDKMRAEFEAKWPVPENCIWNGRGYSVERYNAWDAARYCDKWEGWQAASTVQAAEIAPTTWMHWCETCEGMGTIDETLGGEYFSNPKAECPDCSGNGYWEKSFSVAPQKEMTDSEITQVATGCGYKALPTVRTAYEGFNMMRFARALLSR